MYELEKNGKVFTNKFFGTGPSSYEKRIYRAAVSQRLRNTGTENLGSWLSVSTFWHFPLRTAFYRLLFPSPFKNKVPNKDRDRCNMVGRTKRTILLQFSGTANRNFHLYYFADKLESSVLQSLQQSIQVKYVNLRLNYGFRTASSPLLLAMISTTHKPNSKHQLIFQYLKFHYNVYNYYKYLHIL